MLLLVKVYTTYLSQEELGINDVITQIANWLQPIVTMTISEAVIRFGLDKAYDKKKVFTLGNIICMSGFAVLGLILPIVTITGIADKYLNGYSLLLYVYVVMSGLKLVYSTFVRALEKVKLFAVNGILTTFLTLVGTIVFMMGFKMGNTGYLLSIIVSDGLSVVFLTLSARLWKYFDFHRPDREMLRVMLRYSIPLIPAQILWLITNSSDSFMTTHYLGQGPNGILSASYKIPNLVATVYFMFGQAWNMSAIMEDDSDDRNEFYSNVFELNQCLLYIIAAGCLMIVKPLTGLWLGPDFQSSAQYSPILIYSSVFSCFVTFLGSIYLTSKKTMRSLVTSMVSGALNITLNVILIPRIGLYGPAVSTLVSYSVVFVIRAIDSRKIVPFDLKISKLITNNLVLAAMVLIHIDRYNEGHAFSAVLLPGLFFVILMMNYNPIWKMLRKMLPARIVRTAEQLGIIKLCAIAAVIGLTVWISTLTDGWLFYFTFAFTLAVSLMLNNRKVVYASAAGLFVTAMFEATAGAAGFLTSFVMLMIILRYRRRRDVILLMLMIDICIGSYFGIWKATLVVCGELIVAVAVFYRQLARILRRLMFGSRQKSRRAGNVNRPR